MVGCIDHTGQQQVTICTKRFSGYVDSQNLRYIVCVCLCVCISIGRQEYRGNGEKEKKEKERRQPNFLIHT